MGREKRGRGRREFTCQCDLGFSLRAEPPDYHYKMRVDLIAGRFETSHGEVFRVSGLVLCLESNARAETLIIRASSQPSQECFPFSVENSPFEYL